MGALLLLLLAAAAQDAAVKLKAMMDGREFDDRKVKATYASDDQYYKSQAGEWLPVA